MQSSHIIINRFAAKSAAKLTHSCGYLAVTKPSGTVVGCEIKATLLNTQFQWRSTAMLWSAMPLIFPSIKNSSYFSFCNYSTKWFEGRKWTPVAWTSEEEVEKTAHDSGLGETKSSEGLIRNWPTRVEAATHLNKIHRTGCKCGCQESSHGGCAETWFVSLVLSHDWIKKFHISYTTHWDTCNLCILQSKILTTCHYLVISSVFPFIVFFTFLFFLFLILFWLTKCSGSSH